MLALKKLHFGVWSVPGALLLLCIGAFGWLIPWLGFYQDDWVVIWFARTFGSQVFIDFFAKERPFLAGIYMVSTWLIGDSAIGWQIFGLLGRWVAALAAWWTLRSLWPKKPLQVLGVVFLFTIYPGFKQQYVSVLYSQDFLILAAMIASLGLTIHAVRSARQGKIWRAAGLTVLALILTAFADFSSEYFFGMELFRPLFIWLVVGEQHTLIRQRLLRALKYWLPYLALTGIFLVWRLFIFQYVTYQPQLAMNISSTPWVTIQRLAQTIIEDSYETVALAWFQTLDIARMGEFSFATMLLRWLVVCGSAGLVVFYLIHLQKSISLRLTQDKPGDPNNLPAKTDIQNNAGENKEILNDSQNTAWSKQAILIGGLSLLISGWPFWFTNLSIGIEIPYDRFTLPYMLGVSILIIGILEWLIRTPFQRILIIGLLVGLTIPTHLKIANSFRQIHNQQASLFWQLAWRAPGLKQGTLLLMNSFPFPYTGAMSLGAITNWIYADLPHYPTMDYDFIFIQDKLGNILPALEKGLPIVRPFRSVTYTGSTSEALVMHLPENGCLRILDPQRDLNMPALPLLTSQAIPISNLEQITASGTEAAQRVRQLFGSEPTHGWCYYYEVAELARQQRDWKQVASLADQALNLKVKYYEINATEFAPFIEGYAMTGKWTEARRITLEAYRLSAKVRPLLCTVWDEIAQSAPADMAGQDVIKAMKEKLACSKN